MVGKGKGKLRIQVYEGIGKDFRSLDCFIHCHTNDHWKGMYISSPIYRINTKVDWNLGCNQLTIQKATYAKKKEKKTNINCKFQEKPGNEIGDKINHLWKAIRYKKNLDQLSKFKIWVCIAWKQINMRLCRRLLSVKSKISIHLHKSLPSASLSLKR